MWTYEQNKKKDYENRTRIDEMVPIYVLDFGSELLNMVIQGFRLAHGTIIPPGNLTNKGFAMIWENKLNLCVTRSILVLLIPKYAEKFEFHMRTCISAFYANSAAILNKLSSHGNWKSVNLLVQK